MFQQLKFFALLFSAMFCMGFSRAEPQCGLVNRTIAGLEKLCGYEYTANYDYDHHFGSASNAVTSLSRLLGNCSSTVNTMICSLFVPRCSEEIKGPYLPCRAVCHDYATKCRDVILNKGLEWTVAMCDILPVRDNPRTTKGYRERCFTPPNFKDSGKTYTHTCSKIVVPACQGITGYAKTVVSEAVQRKYSSWMVSKIKYNSNDTCSQPRKEIVCAENLPGCIDGTAAFLCRDSCHKFFNSCTSPFFYTKDMCMEFPKREDTPKDLVICKQTHWPRAENWKLDEHPVSPTTNKTVTPTSQGSSSKTATTETGKSHTPRKAGPTVRGTSTKTDNDNVLPPGMHARGKQPGGKKSSSTKLTIGLVVTFILVLLIAIGIVGFLLYRRKRSHQFDYQKQVLYSEDKAEEFEIFT